MLDRHVWQDALDDIEVFSKTHKDQTMLEAAFDHAIRTVAVVYILAGRTNIPCFSHGALFVWITNG